ncbi:hypothetical protein ABTH23_20130, partial [Acinetobacter baumannii]
IELQFQAMLGRFAGVDRAADLFGAFSAHGRPPDVTLPTVTGSGPLSRRGLAAALLETLAVFRSSGFRKPKNFGPFHRVPVM